MLLLIIGASLWHADRFKSGLATWGWYAVSIIGAVAFGVALRRPSERLAQGAAA